MNACLMLDLFEFWNEMGPRERVHPRDREVLARVSHGFDLGCLPGSFMGPLRTAPVVLLFLSFGLSEFDRKEAQTKKGRDRAARMRKGAEPLPALDDHPPAGKWCKSRTAPFGDYESIRSRVAVLNIGAYHSRNYKDHGLLAALPSSRASLDWGQAVLFPQAERGERVVICLRSAHFWGLERPRKYGRALFAPRVTRAGFMSDHPLKHEAIRAARRRLA